MKFTISKEDFLEGLQQVQHVVGTRTTLPILSNVRLEADAAGLQLTTTDLDVGVRTRVTAEVTDPGVTTLPARRLAGIIRELPAEKVEVSVDAKHTATICCGPSNFRILGLDSEAFPELPMPEDGVEFQLEQAVLRDSLKKTSYAISTDETRYVLNGIFCSIKENNMIIVATDGRRLAMVERELKAPDGHASEIIIPTKAVQELQRLLGDTGEVTMTLGEGIVAFEIDGGLLVSKLVEGNYPNFRQVIPDSTKYSISLDREALQRVVSRISLLANEKSNSVKLHFTKDNIEVLANSPELGDARESLAVSYEGDDVTIAFNPDFLMAPLRNLETDEVELELSDEMSPGIIRNGDSFLYVLMPMRVNQ